MNGSGAATYGRPFALDLRRMSRVKFLSTVEDRPAFTVAQAREAGVLLGPGGVDGWGAWVPSGGRPGGYRRSLDIWLVTAQKLTSGSYSEWDLARVERLPPEMPEMGQPVRFGVGLCRLVPAGGVGSTDAPSRPGDADGLGQGVSPFQPLEASRAEPGA